MACSILLSIATTLAPEALQEEEEEEGLIDSLVETFSFLELSLFKLKVKQKAEGGLIFQVSQPPEQPDRRQRRV